MATIIGQAIAVLVRLKSTTERLEKQIDKQSENMRQMGETFFHALERLEERMDKRFVEVNQRLSDMQAKIRDVRGEMRKLNQNHIEHLNRHHD